jgi:hypothetical protein
MIVFEMQKALFNYLRVHVATFRKNNLFRGTHEAARRSGMRYFLLCTIKRHERNTGLYSG